MFSFLLAQLGHGPKRALDDELTFSSNVAFAKVGDPSEVGCHCRRSLNLLDGRRLRVLWVCFSVDFRPRLSMSPEGRAGSPAR